MLPRLLPIFLILAACAETPRLDRSGSLPPGPPPAILPLDELVAQAAVPGLSDTVAPSVAARAARLRAKAAAMRGPVHDPATRERLSAAIAGRL